MWNYIELNKTHKLFKIWHAYYKCYGGVAKQIWRNNSKSWFHVSQHQEIKNTTKITTTVKSLAEKVVKYSIQKWSIYQRACLLTVHKRMRFTLLSTKGICKTRPRRSFLIWGRSALFTESSVFLYWHKKYCWTWSCFKGISAQGTESRLNLLKILMRKAFMR